MEKEVKTPNFLVDLSMRECIEDLSDEMAGQVFKLLFRYANGEEVSEKELNPFLRYVFKSFKPCIDENKEKYINKVMRNRKITENRKKDQTPPVVTTGNQTPPVVTTGNQTNPLVTTGNQTPPVGVNKTKQSKTKQSETKLKECISKEIHSDSDLAVSSTNASKGVVSKRPQLNEVLNYSTIKNYDGMEMNLFMSELARKSKGSDYSEWQKEFDEFVKKFREGGIKWLMSRGRDKS